MNTAEIIKAKALLKACRELTITTRDVISGKLLAKLKVQETERTQNIYDACVYTEALIWQLETILDEHLSVRERPLI